MTKQRARRPRRVPQRTCVACREVNDKRGLVRLVRTPDEGVQPDPTGKRAGRGAYLHNSRDCWAIASKNEWAMIARALKTELTADDRERLTTYAASLPGDEAA